MLVAVRSIAVLLSRRSPPAPQARQDGLDAQGDGAHGHRSGRVTHGQKVQKEIRLPCSGRCPGDVVQHLLHQHLVVRRHDLGDPEKTPPRPRSPRPSPPLHLRTAATKQLPVWVGKVDCPDAQQAGLNGLLRAAGPGKAAAACSSSSCACDKGEKQIGR